MITITNCGHDSYHPNACDIEHPAGLPDYLLLLTKTDAWCFVEHKRVLTHPGMAILFAPYTYIHYGCDHKDYTDDWIRFHAPKEESEELLASLSFPCGRPLYLYNDALLSQYIQLLTCEFHQPGVHSADIMDSIIHGLLKALDSEVQKNANEQLQHKYHSAFCQLRTKLYNSPASNWSAWKMASSMNMSISYFQHLYRHFFACSCQQDIIHARIEQAKFYLSSSHMSIHDLAGFCGYENELHFMRQFKKNVGMTPSEYRKL